MKEHKKYTDIIRMGHQSTQGVINVGDWITISEKLDGSNSSFMKDEDSPIDVSCYSRNQKLSDSNSLNGFYFWVMENISSQHEKLNPNYRYFGEWLCKHKIVYKENMYKKFYLFSIIDETTGLYLSDEIVKSEAERLGLTTVDYFYEGEYISFEHLMSFVGQSNNTEVLNTGEGIVIKNIKYINKYGSQLFIKMVSEKFAEIQSQKLPKDPSAFNEIESLVRMVLTENRVEKILLKQVDEGLLDENFGIEDMGKILKLITSEIFNDCMKEEPELFENKEMEVVRKGFGKVAPQIIKQILNKR